MKSEHILKSVLLALLVSATFNLAWQVCREVRAESARRRLYEEHGVIACKLGPSQDESARVLIELCLAVALLSCSLGRCLGKLMSLVGLLCAAGIYALWWRSYFVLMEISGGGDEGVPHLFFLYEGVWLDLCIAASLPVVIIWQARELALSLRRFGVTTD